MPRFVKPGFSVFSAAYLCILFFGAGSPTSADESDTPVTGIAATGQKLYQSRCSNCHSNEAAKTLFAPTLHGLIGRKAGSVEGFPYTEKITRLEFNWSAGTLDAWLKSSTLDSPILRLRHLGVEEQSERQALIAYVATLAAK